jgi:hypothetical protein
MVLALRHTENKPDFEKVGYIKFQNYFSWLKLRGGVEFIPKC